MIQKYNMRLTVAAQIESDSPEGAKKALEYAFKSMLENKTYQKKLQNLQIELNAYSIAEIQSLEK